MTSAKSRLAAGATVIALGGVTAVAVSKGGEQARKVPAERVIVRTQTIQETVHVVRHERPAQHGHGGAPAPAVGRRSASAAPPPTPAAVPSAGVGGGGVVRTRASGGGGGQAGAPAATPQHVTTRTSGGSSSGGGTTTRPHPVTTRTSGGKGGGERDDGGDKGD